MVLISLNTVPAAYATLKHYVKLANDHETRDPPIAYYALMHVVNRGMQVDRTDKDCRAFLGVVLDSLESIKKSAVSEEAIQDKIVAQAHIENYALKLFLYADNEDRAGNYQNIKNIARTFYTSGMVFDLLENFEGALTEENLNHCKYAKWKAAYLTKCMKTGETPVPGPENSDDEAENELNKLLQVDPSPAPPASTPPYPPSNLPSYPPPNPTPTTASYAGGNTAAAYDGTTGGVTAQDDGTSVDSELIRNAMKYSKFAVSALQYDDSETAVTNLRKALNLLTVGHE